MTIHAAKGLEFPVVILPELHRAFNYASSDPLIISYSAGIGLSHKENGEQNPIRQQVTKTQRAQTYEEEKRLFYVACTRAKEQLLFVGKQSKRSRDSYLQFLLTHAVLSPKENKINYHFDRSFEFKLHSTLPAHKPHKNMSDKGFR